jgi:uncharacterized membrane protein YcaP (DUF421 family)
MDMILPWWQFPLRALLVFVALLAMLRLSGKRTLSEFTPFDLLLVVLLGEAVAGTLRGGDESIAGGLLLAAALILANWLVGFASARSRAVDRVIDGEPEVVASNGRLFEDRLRRNNVPRSDFDESMRGAQIGSLDEVHLAVLEPNGRITFIRRREDAR